MSSPMRPTGFTVLTTGSSQEHLRLRLYRLSHKATSPTHCIWWFIYFWMAATSKKANLAFSHYFLSSNLVFWVTLRLGSPRKNTQWLNNFALRGDAQGDSENQTAAVGRRITMPRAKFSCLILLSKPLLTCLLGVTFVRHRYFSICVFTCFNRLVIFPLSRLGRNTILFQKITQKWRESGLSDCHCGYWSCGLVSWDGRWFRFNKCKQHEKACGDRES